MKKYNPAKKLVTGIALFVFFYLLYNLTGGPNGLSDFRINLEQNYFYFMSKDAASIISNLVMIVIGVVMIYSFVSGLYRICTFNMYIRTFEDKVKGGVPVKGNTSYPNINRILSYRESRMAGMAPEEAAELYVSSSKLEALYGGCAQGPETLRVLSFIESKLSGMSPDRGLNYLANKLDS